MNDNHNRVHTIISAHYYKFCRFELLRMDSDWLSIFYREFFKNIFIVDLWALLCLK